MFFYEARATLHSLKYGESFEMNRVRQREHGVEMFRGTGFV